MKQLNICLEVCVPTFYGWGGFHCLFQPLIWFTFTKWTEGMKSKDGFMVNVVECCFESCICLCSRHSLAFSKCALKGPLWNLVDLSAGLTPGSGVVCRTQGDWAASGFMPRVLSAAHGNGVESCLVASNADVGKKPWVGLARDHTVPGLP